MIRFDREFHQSDFERFKMCPRMFYYSEVLGMEDERKSEMAFAGSAIHAAIDKAHTENLWEVTTLFDFFKEDLELRIAEASGNGTVVQRGTIDLDDYFYMLSGYVSRSWNREATILLKEQAFTFEIKPSSTIYRFAGHIDQVVSIPTRLLLDEFPLFSTYPATEVVIHRDLKSGGRKGVGNFELLLNDQISIYAYALKYGMLDLNGDGAVSLNLIPDFHALYFLKDHIPYKRPPKGKYKDSPRGPGMYFTRRPLERLKRIPQELMPTCASIRKGDFPREGAARQLCSNHCSVRQYCEADLLQEVV